MSCHYCVTIKCSPCTRPCSKCFVCINNLHGRNSCRPQEAQGGWGMRSHGFLVLGLRSERRQSGCQVCAPDLHCSACLCPDPAQNGQARSWEAFPEDRTLEPVFVDNCYLQGVGGWNSDVSRALVQGHWFGRIPSPPFAHSTTPWVAEYLHFLMCKMGITHPTLKGCCREEINSCEPCRVLPGTEQVCNKQVFPPSLTHLQLPHLPLSLLLPPAPNYQTPVLFREHWWSVSVHLA